MTTSSSITPVGLRGYNRQPDGQYGLHDLNEWLNHIQQLHHRTIDLTLTRVRTVINRIIGDDLPCRVISVAGTNGKGSVSHLIESIFRCAGYSTGLYTSPHLMNFNERFIIDGKQISDADLLNEFQRVEFMRDNVPLTFFEFGTAIAIDYFMQKKVDVAILEVGLGGRKDAVNTLNADIACITSIGLDHEQWLGDTREQIGYEKAGILRTGQIAVCTDADLPQSVRQVARDLSVQLYVHGENFHSQFDSENWSLYLSSSNVRHSLEKIPNTPIPGQCQRGNAAGAVAAALLARKHFNLPDAAIREGVRTVRLDGRLQIVQEHPQILFDVAHNVESVKELLTHLIAHPIGGKNFALMSVLSEKPIELMVKLLRPAFDEWHLCGIDGARGITTKQLHCRVHPVLSDNAAIKLHEDASSGFESLISLLDVQDRIVVFGSFFIVGEVMKLYQEKFDNRV